MPDFPTLVDGLMCDLTGLYADYRSRRVVLFLEGCCDMGGAIRLATAVIPDVERIDTYDGADADTAYVKDAHGWSARL